MVTIHNLFTIIFFILFALKECTKAKELFPLSIIHINDFHSRYEPTNLAGGICDDNQRQKCIGGYARTVHTIKYLLEQQKHKNPLYLNAGDNFQGTLWYNIGRWNVTAQFLNMLPAHAMVLGNHEFDHGIEGMVPFLETIQSPILVANMDANQEPSVQGKFRTSLIIQKSERKIGLIGVTIEDVYDLSSIGNLEFLNESKSILIEAEKLKAQGANIIIVISHCGLMNDIIIAQHTGSVVDVIVGGHSHSFLYTGNHPPGPMQRQGDYPTEVLHESGRRTLIVQAGAYAVYVGNITVYFDEEGNVVDFEGAPIYMGPEVPQEIVTLDDDIVEAIIPWKEIVDEKGNVKIGETKVDLKKNSCMAGECNLGNFYCDSLLFAITNISYNHNEHWSTAAIAITNSGGLRVPLLQGNLTYAHLITMSPFESPLVTFNLPGNKLLEALEFSVSDIDVANNVSSTHRYLQVAGLKIVYDYKRPAFQRVISVKVQCSDCPYPIYETFNTLQIYRIVSNKFLQNGGDGFHMLRDYSTDVEIHPITELDALLHYTASYGPIITGIEDRITVL